MIFTKQESSFRRVRKGQGKDTNQTIFCLFIKELQLYKREGGWESGRFLTCVTVSSSSSFQYPPIDCSRSLSSPKSSSSGAAAPSPSRLLPPPLLIILLLFERISSDWWHLLRKRSSSASETVLVMFSCGR